VVKIKIRITVEIEGESELISLWDVVFHGHFCLILHVLSSVTVHSAYVHRIHAAVAIVVYYSEHSLSLFSAHCLSGFCFAVA